MTTIACTAEEMAADSQATDTSTLAKVRKIWRVDGGILGVCGDYSEAYAFMRWLAGKIDDKPNVKEVWALWIDGKRIWCFDEHLVKYPIEDQFMAIGSGAQGAMCLMHQGYSPANAVAVVRLVDPNTGGRVRTLSV